MKQLLSKLITISVVAFSISGCASMFGDNTRSITVKSQPSGANVYVDGVRYGTTPTVISLPNFLWNNPSLVVKKDGYEDTGVMINTKFQNVGLLNVFFWPGFIIDAATGNMIKIDPNKLNVEVDMTPRNHRSYDQARN